MLTQLSFDFCDEKQNLVKVDGRLAQYLTLPTRSSSSFDVLPDKILVVLINKENALLLMLFLIS